jgi:DNA-binding transcriptional LysR family regulator
VNDRDPLLDFRLSDGWTFLAVHRHASLSAAARELHVTVSQVSKAIAWLEKQFDTRLLTRSSRGVEPSPEAARIVPALTEAVSRLREARSHDPKPHPIVTIAGPSFVVSALSTSAVRAMPQLRIRVLQLAPGAIRATAAAGHFDLAMVVGEPFSLESWKVLPVGELKLSLFATPDVARRLGPQPVDPGLVKLERFVSPVRAFDDRVVPLDDGCPIPIEERRAGHEAQNIGLALDLATASGHVVYGPVAAAMNHIVLGQLVPVAVKGWTSSERLSLAANVDRVTSPTLKAIHGLAVRAAQQMAVDFGSR